MTGEKNWDETDDDDRDLSPGSDVTGELFLTWLLARRGERVAEELSNPVWEWLFRGRLDPYRANKICKGFLADCLGDTEYTDYPGRPRWAGCRMGQSKTELSDGRIVWIAGEHEDHYDPDFYIYNDVIIQHSDDRIQILGYPIEYFLPTDFHSATATADEGSIVLIGSLGYPENRRIGETQVLLLDTDSFEIRVAPSIGNRPGWIHNHSAQLSDDGQSILIQGGQVLNEQGFVENIDDWSWSINEGRWTRLTMRRWIRFRVSRDDGQPLHLWKYSSRQFSLEFPGMETVCDLVDEIGMEPDMETFERLFRPSCSHDQIDAEPEDDESWNETWIEIDGVHVRFNEHMYHVDVTIEGELTKPLVETLAKELQEKLSKVENHSCKWTYIGS